MANNQRIVYLDMLRAVACCMVVLMHSPAPNAGVPGIVQVPIYFLTAGGLVLFFMVSGALLLPTKMTTAEFLKRRIGKIAGPWLFWTVIYMAVNIPESGLTLSEIDKLFAMVSTPGGHIMWFMFVLLGLYLLTPFLSRFLENCSKREIVFYLILWAITLALPLLKSYTRLDLGISSPLYYFSGYVGYFLLGYYIHRYGIQIPSWGLLLCILVPLVCLFANKVLGGVGLSAFGYLSIFVAMMALAWFEAFRRSSISKKLGGAFLVEFSNCSFGIYLMHILIMRHILWKIDFVIYGLGWIGQLAMTWVLTLAISFILTKAISYLPYSEYIIGYHTKRNK